MILAVQWNLRLKQHVVYVADCCRLDSLGFYILDGPKTELVLCGAVNGNLLIEKILIPLTRHLQMHSTFARLLVDLFNQLLLVQHCFCLLLLSQLGLERRRRSSVECTLSARLVSSVCISRISPRISINVKSDFFFFVFIIALKRARTNQDASIIIVIIVADNFILDVA